MESTVKTSDKVCGLCCARGVAKVALVIPLSVITAFVVCYIVFSLTGHSQYLHGYVSSVSNLGVQLPERSIFSVFCNLGAVGISISIFLRYRMLAAYCAETSSSHIQKLSRISAGLGYLSSTGLLIAANFQNDSSFPLIINIHRTGGYTVGVCGLSYITLDTLTSYRIISVYSGRCVLVTRITMTLTAIISGMTYLVWSISMTHGSKRALDWYNLGMGAEWILIITFTAYFITYVPEFTKLHVSIETNIVTIDAHKICWGDRSTLGGYSQLEQHPNKCEDSSSSSVNCPI